MQSKMDTKAGKEAIDRWTPGGDVRILSVMKPIELVEGCARAEAHYADEGNLAWYG
ncbi:hypothetical protein Hdeb2414_s0080g00779581 [Helianthus debilis subsp. tardiflorus]